MLLGFFFGTSVPDTERLTFKRDKRLEFPVDGAFSHVMDFKSQLQEFVQRDGKGSLEYKILNEKALSGIAEPGQGPDPDTVRR
jgi:hypothetical protein